MVASTCTIAPRPLNASGQYAIVKINVFAAKQVPIKMDNEQRSRGRFIVSDFFWLRFFFKKTAATTEPRRQSALTLVSSSAPVFLPPFENQFLVSHTSTGNGMLRQMWDLVQACRTYSSVFAFEFCYPGLQYFLFSLLIAFSLIQPRRILPHSPFTRSYRSFQLAIWARNTWVPLALAT